MAGFDGIDAEFQRRMKAMMADAPGGIGIVSGYRSVAEQQVLYQKYLNGTGNLAAKPGQSNHNHGFACDISFGSPEVQQWVHANAGRYGLHFPVPGENWHIEPIGARDGSMGQMELGGGASAAPMGDPNVPTGGYSAVPAEMSGEDIQAQILSSLGMTPDDAGVGGTEGSKIGSGPQQTGAAQPGVPPPEFSSGPATGVDGIVQAAMQAGFSGEDLRTMVAIGIGESGGNPNAINDTGLDRSVGIWQINQLAHGDRLGTRDELQNPYVNATAARSLFDERGFQPWTVYTSGKYLNHLGEADAAIARMG